MAYAYAANKHVTLNDRGQKTIIELTLWLRDYLHPRAERVAVRADTVMRQAMELGRFGAMSTWDQLAYLDRLCELDVLRPFRHDAAVMTQHQLYVPGSVLREAWNR